MKIQCKFKIKTKNFSSNFVPYILIKNTYGMTPVTIFSFATVILLRDYLTYIIKMYNLNVLETSWGEVDKLEIIQR